MKATELLEIQHRACEKLFEDVLAARTPKRKRELFEKLGANIAAHDAIEREFFYPACEEVLGRLDILGESRVEHRLVEVALFLADQGQGKEDFDFRVKALQDMLMHHIEEEQEELFPKVVRAMEEDRLEVLGQQMEARFEQLMRVDFRPRLALEVRQQLRGKPQARTMRGAAERRPSARSTRKSQAKARPTKARATERRESARTSIKKRPSKRPRAARTAQGSRQR